MRKSTDRILTTHVGSLPAPADLWSLESVSQARLSEATREVVPRRRTPPHSRTELSGVPRRLRL